MKDLELAYANGGGTLTLCIVSDRNIIFEATSRAISDIRDARVLTQTRAGKTV